MLDNKEYKFDHSEVYVDRKNAIMYIDCYYKGIPTISYININYSFIK